MKKVETNPITIIILVVGAVIVGIITGAIGTGKYLYKKFKEIINKLMAEQKKEKEATKTKFEDDLSNKDDIISRKNKIIDELIDLLKEKDDHGKSVYDTKFGFKAYNEITKQRERINKIENHATR